MKVRKSKHSVYRVQYHVVCVTKYRLRLFNPGLQDHLKKEMYRQAKKILGVDIEEINVQREHLHMMMVIPPKYSVSEVVGQLKAKTAGVLSRRYRIFKKAYGENGVIWSSGYFVSTVGIDEHVIRRYIQYQGDLDSGQMKLPAASNGVSKWNPFRKSFIPEMRYPRCKHRGIASEIKFDL